MVQRIPEIRCLNESKTWHYSSVNGTLTAHECAVRFFMEESNITGKGFANWKAMLLHGRYPHTCGRDEARPSSG